MSAIAVGLTEKEFDEQVNPYLSEAKRGFVCKRLLFKAFNYSLYCKV